MHRRHFRIHVYWRFKYKLDSQTNLIVALNTSLDDQTSSSAVLTNCTSTPVIIKMFTCSIHILCRPRHLADRGICIILQTVRVLFRWANGPWDPSVGLFNGLSVGLNKTPNVRRTVPWTVHSSKHHITRRTWLETPNATSRTRNYCRHYVAMVAR